MQLHDVREAAEWLQGRVTGTLCSDSREVRPGDGFVAWPGAAHDARAHVQAALQRGASACLVERAGVEPFGIAQDARVACYAGLKADLGAIAAEFFDHPSGQLAVVAVTGTNGKTSTTWWLAQALSDLEPALAMPCGLIGTLGVGRPPKAHEPWASSNESTVVATGLTTPDPVRLQHTLHRFVQDDLLACAMEASSIGIEEHRLDGTRVRVAVFTNFTQDHLDYHGSMQAYWQAKRRLFAWPGLVSAVVNIDDEQGRQLAQELQAGGLDVWTISCQGSARLQARSIAVDAQGMRFEVVEGGSACVLRSQVIGTYNVSNLLAVLGAMRALGVSLPAAAQACAALHPVPGRMQCVGTEGEPLVVVDYAHSPDALSKALDALLPVAQQRGGSLWCVFGCGGDRDPAKRPLMGAIAAQKADHVVVTSDNPRTEKPESIVSQILLGLPHSQGVTVQVDRALAIAQAVAGAQSGDVVLVAGKGHESTQEISGRKLPFSDLEHAQAALRLRKPKPAEVYA